MNSNRKSKKVISTSSFQIENQEKIQYSIFYEKGIERQIGEFSYEFEMNPGKDFYRIIYDCCIDGQFSENSKIPIDRDTLRPISFIFNFSDINMDIDMLGEYGKSRAVIQCDHGGVKSESTIEVPFKINGRRL